MLDRLNRATFEETAAVIGAIGADLLKIAGRLDDAWTRMQDPLRPWFDPINERHLSGLEVGARALAAEAGQLQGEIDAEDAAADRCEAEAEARDVQA